MAGRREAAAPETPLRLRSGQAYSGSYTTTRPPLAGETRTVDKTDALAEGYGETGMVSIKLNPQGEPL